MEATPEACELVERSKRDRAGELVITIGTGCCESTAPFLYEDFWPGPDQEQVGEVSGVPVFAPEYVRRLYSPGEELVIDVNSDDQAESLSIETEYGKRFTLRRPGQASSAERAAACETSVTSGSVPNGSDRSRRGLSRQVVGELPEALRRVRFR